MWGLADSPHNRGEYLFLTERGKIYDPRVVVHEGLNARYLELRDIGEPVDLATLDVSFISVTLILPAVVRLLRPAGRMVILVKPQF